MRIISIILLLTMCGCAAGSATAGYSVKAGNADDVSSKCRQSIIDEAVDKAFSKSKAYTDERCPAK